MKQVYQNASKCSGCSACKNICPFSAIEMVADKKGFLYPVIDKKKCQDCGLCKSVCQTYGMSAENQKQVFFKFTLANSEELRKSQSGGAFTALSSYVLMRQGIIYGCVYDLENHRAVHDRADNVQLRDRMRGAKYIQSDVQDIYPQLEADLKNDKMVMFCGTPCQCNGIKMYLEKKCINVDKLLLVDLICHGVPSPQLWKDNILSLEKRFKGQISAVDFRNKKFGWRSHIETYKIMDKEYSSEIFKNIFYSNVCLCPSCYQCSYASLDRKTDITIGDAWRASGNYESANRNGESIIIVSSKKGMNVIDELGRRQFKDIEINDFLQPNLQHPTTSKENIDLFWKDYFRFGYQYIVFFYGKAGFINKAFKILRRKIMK